MIDSYRTNAREPDPGTPFRERIGTWILTVLKATIRPATICAILSCVAALGVVFFYRSEKKGLEEERRELEISKAAIREAQAPTCVDRMYTMGSMGGSYNQCPRPDMVGKHIAGADNENYFICTCKRGEVSQ